MLYRAVRHLGGKAPASLVALKRKMLDAVMKGPDAQRRALEDFDKGIAGILKDIQDSGAGRKAVGLATIDIGRAISMRQPQTN